MFGEIVSPSLINKAVFICRNDERVAPHDEESIDPSMFRRDVMLLDVRVIGIDVRRDYHVSGLSANQISHTNFPNDEEFSMGFTQRRG